MHKKMTLSQIRKAQELARQCMKKEYWECGYVSELWSWRKLERISLTVCNRLRSADFAFHTEKDSLRWQRCYASRVLPAGTFLFKKHRRLSAIHYCWLRLVLSLHHFWWLLSLYHLLAPHDDHGIKWCDGYANGCITGDWTQGSSCSSQIQVALR